MLLKSYVFLQVITILMPLKNMLTSTFLNSFLVPPPSLMNRTNRGGFNRMAKPVYGWQTLKQ